MKPISDTSRPSPDKNRKNAASKRNFLLDFLFVAGFVVILTLFGLLFLFLPKKEVSEKEQRALAGMPPFSAETLWDGSYAAGLDAYVSDNLPFRDFFVESKFGMEDLRGVRYRNVKYYGTENAESADAAGTADTATPTDVSLLLYQKDGLEKMFAAETPKGVPSLEKIDLNDPYYAESGSQMQQFLDTSGLKAKFEDYQNLEKEELTGEKRGALFVVGDTALEIFGGSERISLDYADVVNAYADALGKGVTVYNMVIPNHFEFGLPEAYHDSVGKREKPFIDLICSHLSPSVVPVNIYDTLKSHYEAGEYLYFRTDHHWTGLGAYRAYEKFCEYASFVPIPLGTYEKRTTYGFLGTLYNSSLDKKIAENPDFVDYYVIDVAYTQTNYKSDLSPYPGRLISEYKDGKTNGYCTFMGGDMPLCVIETENKNGRRIIIFKESYGNAFIPFLVPHYQTVYVADIRSFPYNSVSFIKENGIGEVMILNNIMSANTPARIANLLELMTK